MACFGIAVLKRIFGRISGRRRMRNVNVRVVSCRSMAGEVRLCSVDRPSNPLQCSPLSAVNDTGVACIPDKDDLKKGQLEAHGVY